MLDFEIMHLAKIGLALLLSVIIGLEREQSKKITGVRDIALVTLGATVFAVLSLELIKIAQLYAPPIRYDLGRIIAYTIVSIGFLGSGVILQHKNKLEGITTASTLWVMVAIGLLCGIGQYILAVVTAICVYVILKLKYIRVQFTNGRGKHGKKRRKIRKTV